MIFPFCRLYLPYAINAIRDNETNYHRNVPHSPVPSDSSWASPKSRIPRPDAERSLVSAVVELLDTTPIPDITVHKIAVIAGVNFGYINRYFETRFNLLAAVTDTLADVAVDQLLENLNTKIPNRKLASKDVPIEVLDQIRLANVVIATKRLRLIQYLIASGVPADRFVAKSKETFEVAITIGSQLGLDEVHARAGAIRFIAMTWIEASLTPILGVTSEELNNAFTLDLVEPKSTSRPKKK